MNVAKGVSGSRARVPEKAKRNGGTRESENVKKKAQMLMRMRWGGACCGAADGLTDWVDRCSDRGSLEDRIAKVYGRNASGAHAKRRRCIVASGNGQAHQPRGAPAPAPALRFSHDMSLFIGFLFASASSISFGRVL